MGLVSRQIARSPLVCLTSPAPEPSFFPSGCQRTIFETSSTSFTAKTTTQHQNIITAHILEWELYDLYRKQKTSSPKVGEDLLAGLPFRKNYHDGRPAREAISAPRNAFPLISVQAIVVYLDNRKHGNAVWRVVVAKRSEDVVVKPGLLQFQPSGGFDVFGSEIDDSEYLLHQGFDVGLALLREYAEELFDAKQFRTNQAGIDPLAVLSHPEVSKLTMAVNTGNASIQFLGTVVDLTVLRHELSFLVLIEDEFFCNSPLTGSWEAKNIYSPTVGELRDFLHDGVLHGGSAGLLQLALENPKLADKGLAM